MTVEFIPTPQQLMDLTTTGQQYRVVPAKSHKLYYVYPTDDVAEFTAEMMGIHKVGASINNQVTQLADVILSWDNKALYHHFEAWRHEYNKRAAYEDSYAIPKAN